METLLSSPDLPQLIAAVREMLRTGRPAAARPLLTALGHLAPDAPEMAELESGLAAAEGRLPEAIGALGRAVAAAPGNAALRMRRAGLRHRSGDLPAALSDATEAVIAAPHDASAKALLGLLLVEAGEGMRARACLAEASAADPDNAPFRLGLAEAAIRTGDAELACATLKEGIARAPGRVDLRRALIRLAFERGDPEAAWALAETAQRDGLADAGVLRLRAAAAAALGRHAEAQAALTLALNLDPADPSLRYVAAAAGLLAAAERAPVAAVRGHFDATAGRFERDMIAAGDRVPGLVRAAVLRHCPLTGTARLGPVLDLGCGTGLAAIALSDLALGPFIGVDVSPRMLARANSRGLYAELTEADLVPFLAAERRRFPLVLAADVLAWFGALEPVFAAVAERLAPGGVFILSVEEFPPAAAHDRTWVLGPSGRYAQSRLGVEQAAGATGLGVRSLTAEPLRVESGAAVAGLIAVLEHASDAG